MAKRVAIIGLGAVTQNIHLPAYSNLKDKIEIVAGCDIDKNLRTAVARKWHLPQLFGSPQEMIEKTKPDIVSICTPPFLHHEQTLMALDFGCHVFCEKPQAESLTQVDEIIQSAEKANRFVVVNSQFPCMNIHTAAKEFIGSPEFGRLLYLHAHQTFCPTAHTEAGWRGEMQRRVCFEFGVHVFELIRYFFEDMPTRLFAHMPSPQSNIKSDVINIISLQFKDGRAASIILDRLSKGPDRYLDMSLDGEAASISTSIGGELRFEAGLHTRERRPFLGFNFVKGGKAVLRNGNKSKTIAKDGMNPFASATATLFRSFVEAMDSGEPPPIATAKDNRNTLALAFAAYDSAESGQVVNMSNYLK